MLCSPSTFHPETLCHQPKKDETNKLSNIDQFKSCTALHQKLGTGSHKIHTKTKVLVKET